MQLGIIRKVAIVLALAGAARARAEEPSAAGSEMVVRLPAASSQADSKAPGAADPTTGEVLPAVEASSAAVGAAGPSRVETTGAPAIESPVADRVSGSGVASSSAPSGAASPQAVTSIAAQATPVVGRERRMGWGGIGVRAGFSEIHLVPPAIAVAGANAASTGRTFTADDFALRQSARELTPTIHLGGSGYFFKFDLPYRQIGNFTSYGLGIYPINVGIYIDRLATMPYLSAGGTANLVYYREEADQGSSKVAGFLMQARAALGLKYFPASDFTVSFEVGLSKAVGAMVTPSTTVNGESMPRGGVGSILDGSVGVEWL